MSPLKDIPQNKAHIEKRMSSRSATYSARFSATTHKVCTCCKEDKPIANFHKRSGRKFGYKPLCISCAYERTRQWKAANKDKTVAHKRAFQERNRAHRCAYQNLRHAATLKRTIPWANLDHIKGMYEICAVFRRVGLDLQVDHIIPMQGELVSGLHVETNLQLMGRIENISKKNRFNIEEVPI